MADDSRRETRVPPSREQTPPHIYTMPQLLALLDFEEQAARWERDLPGSLLADANITLRNDE